jgi:hypothetical protein
MNTIYPTILGSGTTPTVQDGPVHNITAGTFPLPAQRDQLRSRQGEGAVILNPEDFSVSVGLSQAAITVDTTAVALPESPLENRRALVVHNSSNGDVYLGNASVTTANGLVLAAGEKIAFDIQGTPNVKIYAIAASSLEVRILELA